MYLFSRIVRYISREINILNKSPSDHVSGKTRVDGKEFFRQVRYLNLSFVLWFTESWSEFPQNLSQGYWIGSWLLLFVDFIRTRLSYEQFGAFLANVKELNSHKQNKEVSHQIIDLHWVHCTCDHIFTLIAKNLSCYSPKFINDSKYWLIP